MIVVVFVVVAIAATLVRATLATATSNLPWPTLALNVAGAFVLGIALGAGWDHEAVVSGAGLGSLTTFSTVAGETSAMVRRGRRADAIAYVVVTIAVGVAAAYIGLRIGDPR